MFICKCDITGFTVGDELGFPESLSNVEFNRRRSSQTNGFQNVLIAETMKNKQNVSRNKHVDHYVTHYVLLKSTLSHEKVVF